jgi:hypothetical protein
MRRLALIGVLAAVGVSLATASAALGDTLSVSCGPSNGPCDQSGDWQSGPLSVTWDANPVPSNVAGCVSTTYTDVATTVSCQVWWGSTTQLISFPLNVETSSPTATVTPSRPPDSNGWYNHAVTLTTQGFSFSGIASCTPTTTYAGPSTTTATVSGTCTDNAGKTVTVTSAPFDYDATSPTLNVAATPGDESIGLSWQAGGDIAPIVSMTVARTSSSDSKDPVVYSGSATGFNDTNLKNGVRYTYTVTAQDAAGNTATRTLQVTPAARLLSPAANARVSTPPALTWTAVPGATYYNVQLYRGDPTKLLSLWPVRASLQLHRTWRFDGRRYHLKPGRYKWYVWPGFGKRKAARYGHMVGSGTFTVVR